MSEDEVQAEPVVKVARDLTEIVALSGQLPGQAVNDSNAALMPGGRAMVALGPVANLEAWENMTASSERYGRAYTSAEDEDPDDAWSAFQRIEFWSEQWRREHGAEYGQRPTIASEANFLRYLLNWAWDNLMEWDDFAADIKRARIQLEDIVSAGTRAERGAPCLYEGCRGIRLVRKLEPARDKDGYRIWRHSKWHCPRCHREWDEDAYARMVTAAHESTKSEEIEGETWCTVDVAARKVDRPQATIRVWMNRGHIATLCLIKGRRAGFVRLGDVRERDENTRRRKRAA